jgi:uncharacterized protein YecE (DUF72 family)
MFIMGIFVGVTGWGDHDALYPKGLPPKEKLQTYAGHFPIVEIDASFYAIQPIRNYERWVNDTPANFRFIPKVYQGMTEHMRGDIPFSTKEEMVKAYRQSIQPLLDSGKLAMILFQFPPWFDCQKKNVETLKFYKEAMADLPLALEFRNQTWFSPKYYDRTLQFMEDEGWIHSICDEPQAGKGSIPTVLKPTDKDKTLIRFHGRNVHGWNSSGQENWREVRFLYRYNEQELLEWKENILQLQKHSKDIYIVFNNNSGGDASDNAKQLIDFLEIEYEGLAPRQLDLF